MESITDEHAARFWANVDQSGGPDACWEWQGSRYRQQGYDWPYGHYGTTTYAGRSWVAHRLAYTLTNGPIPNGMIIMHTCDNPPCCNPSHLRAGTHRENMSDKKAKGRGNNHSWKERNR